MDRPVLETGVDRYVIVSHLAEGGMGAIFLGKKVGIGGFVKDVVLKQLLPEFTSQAEFIDLFLREARLSASLDHANIVHTIDLVSAGSDYFIVMEYVDGGDLRTIQRRAKRRGQQLLPAAGIFIVREVLAALAYAHDKKDSQGRPLKLIHRDISPSNIMVSSAGQVKLTDFGIAKAATHKSVFYRVKGKVGYMSPEQARGSPLDHRSDLYSAAVVLHELLAGERLFVADLMSLPEQIYSQPVRELEDDHAIPRGTDAVLRKSLAIDPEDRYQTALEFLDALVEVTMNNGILFNSSDLAAHLRAVCGDDPSKWSEEHEEFADDRPGTLLLDGDGSGDIAADQDSDRQRQRQPGTELAYSGVELTSMIADRGEFAAAAFQASVSDWDVVEETDDSWASQQTVAYQGRSRRAADGTEDRQRRPGERRAGTEPLAGDNAFGPAHGPRELRAPRPFSDPRASSPGGDPRTSEPLQPVGSAPRLADRIRHHSAPGSRPLSSALDLDGPRPAVAEDEDGPRPISSLSSHSSHSWRLGSRAALASTVDVSPAARGRVLMLVVAGLLLVAATGIVVLVGLYEPDSELPADSGASRQGPAAPAPALRDAEAHAPQADLAASPPPADLAAPPPPADLEPTATDSGASSGVDLTVESSPARAAVFLDGVRQCRTTCTVRNLDPGHVYVLSVRRKNYVSWSRLVDPRARQPIAAKAYLSEEPDSRRVGYLVVRAAPAADVSIDGTRIGHVTSEGRIPLAPGRHEITLSHPRRSRRLRFVVMIYRQRITTTERMRF